ncbi:MAG: hypothetical protein QXH51_06745 [Candidatus Bathyarchaeia archaeon]
MLGEMEAIIGMLHKSGYEEGVEERIMPYRLISEAKDELHKQICDP